MATKKKNNLRAWEIGGAITAATLAAAAGAYLLADKKTKDKAKSWVVKARKEVAKHAEHAKKLGKAEYDRFVEQAVKKYGSLENLSPQDVIAAAQDLKAEWDNIQMHAKEIAKSVKNARGTVSKKPASRTASTSKSKSTSSKKTTPKNSTKGKSRI